MTNFLHLGNVYCDFDSIASIAVKQTSEIHWAVIVRYKNSPDYDVCCKFAREDPALSEQKRLCTVFDNFRAGLSHQQIKD